MKIQCPSCQHEFDAPSGKLHGKEKYGNRTLCGHAADPGRNGRPSAITFCENEADINCKPCLRALEKKRAKVIGADDVQG